MKTIYQEAIEKWGEDAQIDMLQEECIELAFAVSKLRRYNGHFARFDNLCEEIADVEILIKQMKTIPVIKELYNQHKSKKLKRLRKRINNS